MYSFAQRKDTQVIDEPFYGYYLKSSGVKHPGRDETLANMPTDAKKILDNVIYRNYNKAHVYFKNMAHHLIGVDLSFLKDCTNILLIRHPRLLIASFSKVIPIPTITDIGLKHEAELYNTIQKLTDEKPIVIDTGQLQNNPKKYLEKLCESLNIQFDKNMLEWKPGPRPEDGVWAKYWYSSLHKSTGFSPVSNLLPELSNNQRKLFDEAMDYYSFLYKHSLKL